jgi:UDP-N-acetylglucosamine 2-epimerase (non-hydrolysing)
MEFLFVTKENNNNKFNKKPPKYIKKYLIILTILLFILLLNKYLFLQNLKNFVTSNKYRIAIVFGTRPEAVKLIPLIKELKENKNFLCITINTGQHKEMIQQILKSFNIENSIDFNLNIMAKNQSLSKLTSQILSKLEKIYSSINPNAIIVQGDTTTGFAAAVSAFYQKIPVFHVEAGLRTHNLYFPFPEEFNRVSIDDLSTLYFAPTDWAASNLLKENKNSSNIFVTGNTVVDVLKLTLNNTSPSTKIKKLIEKAKSLCISKNECKIILLTCHRRENYFNPIYNILNSIQKILKEFNDIIIIFPFHLNPNIKQSIKKAIPSLVYDDIISGRIIKKKKIFIFKSIFHDSSIKLC